MSTNIIYEREGARERIVTRACALAGVEVDVGAETLCDLVLSLALSHCGRRDVPIEMESAVAVILSQRLGDSGMRNAKTVKRGDVSVTYESTSGGSFLDFHSLLAPFVKLRSI